MISAQTEARLEKIVDDMWEENVYVDFLLSWQSNARERTKESEMLPFVEYWENNWRNEYNAMLFKIKAQMPLLGEALEFV